MFQGDIMEGRKAIPKKLRFEVFKRDSFTCQYCGKSAPDIILEVDHIHPVSRGGEEDITNLITSCFDCNRGKGTVR
jgi:5-methylcytosine-specific restriction endonuclease McrA